MIKLIKKIQSIYRKIGQKIEAIVQTFWGANLMIALFSAFLYFFTKTEAKELIIEVILVMSITKVGFYLLYSLEKIIETHTKNRGYFSLASQYFMIILLMNLSFAIDYWLIYSYDANSFSGSDKFGQTFYEQIFTTFYYSVITFMTIGYGDIYPQTFSSRFVCLIEVLTSLIMLIYIFSNMATVKEALIKENPLNYNFDEEKKENQGD